jgi:signal transduction histidine kinase
VRVELSAEHDWIAMTVGDNGVGLQDGGRHKPSSFGLVGIEERIKILGGSFSVTSSPGAGTTVHVSVPAQAEAVIPDEFGEPIGTDDVPVAFA